MAQTAQDPRSIATLDRLIAHLQSAGIVTEAELRERMDAAASATPRNGALLVARAWTDPQFKDLLLRDGTAAAESFGFYPVGGPPLGVLENTPNIHHLVVCTLCSCYPRWLLGYPPHWYKSSAYRARAARNPRQLLEEWGMTFPRETEIQVVDSTADYRWMVLPMQPPETVGWTSEQLVEIVTADSLVGADVIRLDPARSGV
ncbi:nitrile hydratase subunit alpha [Roseixanthobacter glucoisosaccharinicivorans]|uniref:nitrile hydratase subunit alpha n=1 Tax=Roseixanthobacter glucoisosaccharinicivorans TaxID=3119923 RepID=UPI00372CCA45